MMASTWYCKELGNGVASFEPAEKIQAAFRRFVHDDPLEMAVFSHHDGKNHVVTAYFSPAAEALALTFGATPCGKPVHIDRLSLLVGHGSSRQTHFPKH
jgi:hypothetical protein